MLAKHDNMKESSNKNNGCYSTTKMEVMLKESVYNAASGPT